MKLREHMSVLWLSIQIYINELQLKWLMWKHHKSEQAVSDDFDEWIPLIRAMNPEIPENIFLGE